MGLPATRKPVTEEDRGEDNKGPDWLIEQGIVKQVARGGGPGAGGGGTGTGDGRRGVGECHTAQR